MATETPKLEYRVWHMPQVGANIPTFYVSVENLKQAKIMLSILADYDLFQYNNNVKPDYSNAQGLEQRTEGTDWEDFNIEVNGNYYDDIDEYFEMETE